VTQPTCPHCGGLHFGQRYDNCPYVRILADPNSTEEQRKNAADWLNSHNRPSRGQPPQNGCKP
jgi:hypothetical protein